MLIQRSRTSSIAEELVGPRLNSFVFCIVSNIFEPRHVLLGLKLDPNLVACIIHRNVGTQREILCGVFGNTV